MLHEPNGPRGAKEEREDFWTDIPEGADMLPGEANDAIGTLNVLGGPARLNAADPMSPSIITNQPVIHDLPDPTGSPAFDRKVDNAYGVLGPAEEDPLGSWTGVPADGDEDPTQDADDL